MTIILMTFYWFMYLPENKRNTILKNNYENRKNV